MKAFVTTTTKPKEVSLDVVCYGSYVRVIACPGFPGFVGRSCIWTNTSELVPLDNPFDSLDYNKFRSCNVTVEVLPVGETLTITIQ
jgi:hypothetical protein